jgi:hypothetical protein
MSAHKFPTLRAVAYRLVYGPKWKMGQSPEKIRIGAMLLPNCYFVDQCERAIRRKFKDANAFRIYGNDGDRFFSGSL